jgi:nucleoside-diphosphate-sugar epimerase
MKIAVTGTSSGIGAYLVKRLEELGHEVFYFTRNPAGENDVLFDIEKPKNIEHDCNTLIHLGWRYWDIGDPIDLNLIASAKLLDSFQENSKVIFLSSLSAYTTGSKYGHEKLLIEELFLARSGLAIRAGVLWGGHGVSGILSTIVKIANTPVFCLHPSPEPVLFLTHYEDIFEEIFEYLEAPKRTLAISGNKKPVPFVELLHAIDQKSRIHLSFSLNQLPRIAKLCRSINIRIPFRIDSLNGVLNDYVDTILKVIESKSSSTYTVDECKNWLTMSTKVERD